MSVKESEDLLYNASYLQEKIHSAYVDAIEAYDVLEKHDTEVRYQLSLDYLSMSFQSYLEAKRVYFEAKMEHYDIDPFFQAYDHYKFQLTSNY